MSPAQFVPVKARYQSNDSAPVLPLSETSSETSSRRTNIDKDCDKGRTPSVPCRSPGWGTGPTAYAPFVLTLTLACALAFTASAAPALPSPAPATNAPTFHSSLRVASEAAQADASLVMLIFGAEWCPPCQALKKETLPAEEFRSGAGPVRIVEIDVDADEATATRFGVSSLPALFLMTADGKIVGRQGGFLDSTNMIRWLEEGRRRARSGQWEGTAPGLKLDALLAKAATPSGLNTNDLTELTALLGDRNPGERLGAERLLLAQREKAVLPLINALLDGYLGTRIGASDALQRLAPHAPSIDPWQPVTNLAPNVAGLRRWWTDTGKLPPPRSGATNDSITTGSIQAAIDALRGDDLVHRTAAMSTLSSHGAAALPAIRDAIKRAERTNPRTVALLEDVRWSILIPESIERRTPGVRAALARGASAERQAAAGRLGRAGRESVDALGELANDPDPLVVESAVRALSGLGGREVLPALAALLKASDSNLRMTAAQALGRTKSSEATRHLLTALEDPNEVVAGAALSALVEVNAKDSPFNPTPGAKEPLGAEAVAGLRQAFADPRWRVRAAAVEAAGKLQVADLGDDMKKLLADPDGFVVKNTLLALKGLREEPAQTELVAIARRLPALQGDAIAMLAATASSDAVNDVLALFTQASVSGQTAILAALGVRERYDDKPLNPDWKPVLVKAQTSPAVEVRRQLATLLRLAPPTLAAEIVGPLLGDDDPTVRDDAAVVAFGVISGRKKTAVGTMAHLAFDLDAGDDETPLHAPSRRGAAATNAEPAVKAEQLQTWHAATTRIALSDLTPVTAALLVATGDTARDLPKLTGALDRATPAGLEKLAEASAVPVLATRLPWPEGRSIFGHLEKQATLYLQALKQSSKLKPEAAEFLLDPARFLRAVNPVAGDMRHMVVERLLSAPSREQPGWSLLDADPRSRRIVDALAQSTNAVWRALSVYVRGRPDSASESRPDFAKELQDTNPWVRAAAVQALANRRIERAELERMAGPLLADDNARAASIAAFALMEPSLRQAAGFAWQFGYFLFEDIQAGGGERTGMGTQDNVSPILLTNQPAYLELARRQVSRMSPNEAAPFALLLAQHGDFSALDKAMQGDSEMEALGRFQVPEALLAAISLSRNPRYLPRIREWMEQINNEWEVPRLLKAIKGIPGPEARQLRVDLNRRMRFPKPGAPSELMLSPDSL